MGLTIFHITVADISTLYYLGIFHGILLVPHNIVMDMNNIMLICCAFMISYHIEKLGGMIVSSILNSPIIVGHTNFLGPRLIVITRINVGQIDIQHTLNF